MSKISERKFTIYITTISIIAPFIVTAIIDKWKDIPITSTLVSCIKWIWNTIFEHEFKVWHILAAIIVLIIFLFIIGSMQSKSEQTQFSKSWLEYMKDEFGGIQYKWRWEREIDGKSHIKNLRPICDCGTTMRTEYNNFHQNDYATCPRCNSKKWITKNYKDIEAIIIDNIERGLYKDKI